VAVRRSTLAFPAALAAAVALAQERAPLEPGLYEVTVTLALPNVKEIPLPEKIQHCVTPESLRNGAAFAVLSENPAKQCNMLDYEITGGGATFRVDCLRPNSASGKGVFELYQRDYRGTISLQMGAKNMTMSELQSAHRIGDCRAQGSER
jgi:Protein of unknown function (DUF3617)